MFRPQLTSTPEAATAVADLVRVSRLLGADSSLVLHGGGNTSVKTVTTDLTGRLVPTLFVKASGHDLATIDEAGFAPLRLDRLRDLLPPVVVPDDLLRNELRCALLDAEAADPSVETLVHVLLPHSAVLHSHADVLLSIANTPDGAHRLRELFGERLVIVPYAMPGPDLVAGCAAAWAARTGGPTDLARGGPIPPDGGGPARRDGGGPARRATGRDGGGDDPIGLLVLGHGLFTVGDSPDEAYRRHLDVVAEATAHVRRVGGPPPTPAAPLPPVDPTMLAELRRRLSAAAGRPMVVTTHRDAEVAAFVADPGLLAAAVRGPLTPDHVIWTRRAPLVGTDLDAFARGEDAYFTAHAGHRDRPDQDRPDQNRPDQDRRGSRGHGLVRLDPAPRVVLDPALGMLTAGRTAREAAIAEDIYRHTMRAVRDAEALGGYRPADPEHVFDLEYWSPQQAKLSRADGHLPLAGQVAVVTGAASGIGRACAASLLAAGASVVGWDVSPSIGATFTSPEWRGLRVDVTDGAAMADALDQGVRAFGGVDILVVAAGVFPGSANLGELSMATWRRAMAVNVDAVADLYHQIHPLLAAAVPYGRVVLIASKNVAAPGPGAAAYSASKAAVTQLTRVAALEWAADGIRVNMIHPDAVFDTGLWTPELLATRAAHYGMSVERYKRRNLLKVEVTSRAVGDLAVTLAGPSFGATTGAQVPIDGGNERVL